MAIAPDHATIGIGRLFTSPGVHPYDMVEWVRRDARITDFRDGSVAFEQLDVEVPAGWSVNATNILAQKYFRGPMGSPERETSLRQVADRVADTITRWGIDGDYFATDEEAEAFNDELKFLIITQRAAFNSPVWFNIGVAGVPQQASACFILSVDDDMESILNWYAEEGMIFKGGSGSGVNLSNIRGSIEPLNGGGTASGPVSFMRGADASAGTIKSGGKTRRAAKMVVLDADHPDIEEFIWCKAIEEHKARALRDAGFDMDLDGADSFSIQYQNANNSVRLSDEFMEAALADADWHLTARADGRVIKTVKAAELLRQVSDAAWQCADPGVQFDTTINRWHTAANTDRINASNPCSEYFHLDNSACNLASLNLLSFLVDDGAGNDAFDIDAFTASVSVMITAQEILVGNASYPTDEIAQTTKDFRQLGLGYANLGALLMALGLPYDSDDGRAIASAITALMTGNAYLTSARTAARLGPFAGYHDNREPMLRVLAMHRDALPTIDASVVPAGLLEAAHTAWDHVCSLAPSVGVRNAQTTVLAPTGTISFLMDCDTTGIEPDLGLVKLKKLVGGGTMTIVNQTVERALTRLGYTPTEATDIMAHIEQHHSVIGAPHLLPEHLAVFACSMGDNTIHYRGHLAMMAAAQPWLSGGISKTVNVPEDVTIDDIDALYREAWQLGIKSVAVYRNNCKVGQPLSTGVDAAAALTSEPTIVDRVVREPIRQKLPRNRASRTFEFRVADCKGFCTVGEYEDGSPGEIFVRVSKQGSTLAGIMDGFAIAVSHGLQYGVPLRAYVDAFVGMRFEPAGMTDDPELRIANSLMDYLFRKLAVMYLAPEERAAMNIFTTGERTQPTLPGVVEMVTETVQGHDVAPDPPTIGSAAELAAQMSHGVEPRDGTPLVAEAGAADAPLCMQCGVHMHRAGSCFACPGCGSTSGCS